jgi:hypothetical protein
MHNEGRRLTAQALDLSVGAWLEVLSLHSRRCLCPLYFPPIGGRVLSCICAPDGLVIAELNGDTKPLGLYVVAPPLLSEPPACACKPGWESTANPRSWIETYVLFVYFASLER